jgi:hypothetical protein
MSMPHPGEPSEKSRTRYVFPPLPGRAWLTELGLPSPTRHDHVIFLRGLPVAPWMTLRPWAEVWAVWLARLEALFQEWQAPLPDDTSRQIAEADLGWGVWRDLHVHSVEARRVEDGLADLLSLLQGIERSKSSSGAHLIGHSVGGAVIVSYLAGLRARMHTPPELPVRAALTLDAAVSGLAGVWSGAKSYLHRVTGNRVMGEGLFGLNDWAADQGIRLLTASNHRDLWSHQRLADVPYLGVRLGSRFALRDQLNGTIHDWLRRTPEFVHAIWGPVPIEEN